VLKSKMNRKNIGILIGFMILFSMCLIPTMFLLNQKPIINYYYEENYYTKNETISELNINYIETSITFLNLTDNPKWFYSVSYNLISGYEIFFDINNTFYINPIYCYIIPDYLFEIWNEDNREHYYHIGGIKAFINNLEYFSFWIPENSGVWHFCWWYSGVANNITIKTIYPIFN